MNRPYFLSVLVLLWPSHLEYIGPAYEWACGLVTCLLRLWCWTHSPQSFPLTLTSNLCCRLFSSCLTFIVASNDLLRPCETGRMASFLRLSCYRSWWPDLSFDWFLDLFCLSLKAVTTNQCSPLWSYKIIDQSRWTVFISSENSTNRQLRRVIWQMVCFGSRPFLSKWRQLSVKWPHMEMILQRH